MVGAGASGVFAAICLANKINGNQILILEKTSKPLQKVKVSGGGRCNVTHSCFDPAEMSKNYPRGGKRLKIQLYEFGPTHMIEWLKSKGVELHTEDDGRMFPTTNQSQTIIDCFLKELIEQQCKINYNDAVIDFEYTENQFKVLTNQGTYFSRTLLLATGGFPKAESYKWLSNKGLEVVSPYPSLFTFNDPEKTFTDLMGISIESVKVKIAGTNIQAVGPLLFTHWGISGPAVLRCSAFGAQLLHEKQYNFQTVLNFLPEFTEHELTERLVLLKNTSDAQLKNKTAFNLPNRFWLRIVELSGIKSDTTYKQLNTKQINKLVSQLSAFQLPIKGKTTFKDEFVTAGGIATSQINGKTMESFKFHGLFFAGELVDVDGVTGGFNFQHAWTSAYLAANGIFERLKINTTKQ